MDIVRNTVKKHLQLADAKGFIYVELIAKSDQELDKIFCNPEKRSEQQHGEPLSYFPYVESELRKTGVKYWELWGKYQ